jgi:hypothetical protein
MHRASHALHRRPPRIPESLGQSERTVTQAKELSIHNRCPGGFSTLNREAQPAEDMNVNRRAPFMDHKSEDE